MFHLTGLYLYMSLNFVTSTGMCPRESFLSMGFVCRLNFGVQDNVFFLENISVEVAMYPRWFPRYVGSQCVGEGGQGYCNAPICQTPGDTNTSVMHFFYKNYKQ